MHFCFYPKHEHGCPEVNHCPHLGGASLGMLVKAAEGQGDYFRYLHGTIATERERNTQLVEENQQLHKELKQAKLELKLERQNKFATNEQKNQTESSGDDEGQTEDDTSTTEEAKKRGAPVGHPGWFRPTPSLYDWLVEVAAPRCCPHCGGAVSASGTADPVDHLQEDIIENVYRVVCYRHPASQCDDCDRWVQQSGKDELLNCRIGPYLRSLSVWLRNVIGISYRKIPQIIEEVYGITFTPAALIGFETLLAEESEPLVDDITKKLASSDGAVHADETYWTTDGIRSYFWVHADLNNVHFQYDTSRAGEVSRNILGDDFVGTLVTDCYSGYTASTAGAKQKCLAHLSRTARDWQKLTEKNSLDYVFFEDIKLFAKRGCEFHRLRNQGKLNDDEQSLEKTWLCAEQSRLETCRVEHEKAITLQARLLRHTLEWLVFLDDSRVPPTNNLAERALRPLVILRKITFGHRSDEGARRMAKLMTIAETARRRGHRVSDIYFELYTRPPDRVLRKLYGSA